MTDKKITILSWLERLTAIYNTFKQLYMEKIIDKDLNLLKPEKEKYALKLMNENAYILIEPETSTWQDVVETLKEDIEVFDYVLKRKN